MDPVRKAADYRHRHSSKGWGSDRAFRKGWPKKEAQVQRSYRSAVNRVLRSVNEDADLIAGQASALARRRISKTSEFLAERIRRRLRRKVATEYKDYLSGIRDTEPSESDLIAKLFGLAETTSLYAAAVSHYLFEGLIAPTQTVGLSPLVELRKRFADDTGLTERLILWKEQSDARFPEIYGPKTLALTRRHK